MVELDYVETKTVSFGFPKVEGGLSMTTTMMVGARAGTCPC